MIKTTGFFLAVLLTLIFAGSDAFAGKRKFPSAPKVNETIEESLSRISYDEAHGKRLLRSASEKEAARIKRTLDELKEERRTLQALRSKANQPLSANRNVQPGVANTQTSMSAPITNGTPPVVILPPMPAPGAPGSVAPGTMPPAMSPGAPASGAAPAAVPMAPAPSGRQGN